MKYDTLTDEALLERLCQTTERNAQNDLIAELFERYAAHLLRWLTLKTRDAGYAEELAAQTVEKMLNALRKHAGTRAPSPIQHFQSWLQRIAHNVFLDDLQRKKRKPTHFLEEATVGKPLEERLTDTSALERAEKIHLEYRYAMQELALFLLSDAQREVYMMRYIRQAGENKRMSVKQVAEALSLTERAVWTHLKTGKERLEKWIARAEAQQFPIEQPEALLPRLLEEVGLPNEANREATEAALLAPALHLLAPEQTRALLQQCANEALSAESKKVLPAAKENLYKMLDGKRDLDAWLLTNHIQHYNLP